MQGNKTTLENGFGMTLIDGDGAHGGQALWETQSSTDTHPGGMPSDVVLSRAIVDFVTRHRTAIATAYIRYALRRWFEALRAGRSGRLRVRRFLVTEPPVGF